MLMKSDLGLYKGAVPQTQILQAHNPPQKNSLQSTWQMGDTCQIELIVIQW